MVKKTTNDNLKNSDRGPLQKHISKSASDLSDRSRSVYEQDGKIRPHSASSSGASHNAQNLPQKTQGFFSSLRSRWYRSKSRERRVKKKLGDDGCVQKDGASTDYAADNSSDHSSSATQSPQHKISGGQHIPEYSSLGKMSNATEHAGKFRSVPSSSPLLSMGKTILPALPVFTVADDTKKNESCLRQHSFFQLRVHLKRGVDLIARDKGGTSDPYVKFKVGGRLLYKSKTLYRDLNPIWDETFTIPIEDAFVPVHIKVFDYDWGLQDDFMGSAYLDLTKLDPGKSTEISLELLDPGKTEYLGEILLTVTLVPKTQEDKDLKIQQDGNSADHQSVSRTVGRSVARPSHYENKANCLQPRPSPSPPPPFTRCFLYFN
ncbi:hypothetical protein RUM43_005205 [Polyplax serrata]|uniref:C2 domain-containing protein n=1 Tax=Polyplax serrata TaxID=468196 RepID=A0AAN8SBR5_POLSC